MSTELMETRALKYEFSIDIDAPREAVWTALTQETNAWWLPDFHMVGADSVVTLDARAGGQLVETNEAGGSLLWYEVQMCTPGESLHLVGHIGADWGGPATTMLTIKLEQRGDTTTLRVADALLGCVSASMPDSLEEGWKQLFGAGLKAHVESR